MDSSRNMAVIAVAAIVQIFVITPTYAGMLIGENEDLYKKLQSLPLKKIDEDIYLLGDILLRDAEDSFGFVGNRWTNGILPIAFEPGTTEQRQTDFMSACESWETGSPIHCQLHNGEKDHLLVRTHTGGGKACGGFKTSCSFIGRQGGEQELWMFEGQWSNRRTIVHELGHALGMVHEHARPDRDQYVYVKPQNMRTGAATQFSITSGVQTYTEYDFASVMHYPNCAFSKHSSCNSNTPNLQTIEPRACNRTVVGGALDASQLDLDGVRAAYAPALSTMLLRGRTPQCGQLIYHPQQWATTCENDCQDASAVSHTKVDELYNEWCGFVPIYDPQNFCKPLVKDYITHWTDNDSLSCGFPPQNRHELWVRCGCAAQTVSAKCSDLNGFTIVKYSSKIGKENWRKGRLVYFIEIFENLKKDGLISTAVEEGIGKFVQANYLDQRFETKLGRFRAGIWSYARWKRKIDPNYKIDVKKFNKIAIHKKLRPI